jgi:hypothetical protein
MVMLDVVRNGHLAMCKYLYAQGCSWKPEHSIKALDLRKVAFLDWAMSEGIQLSAQQQRKFNKLKLEASKLSS